MTTEDGRTAGGNGSGRGTAVAVARARRVILTVAIGISALSVILVLGAWRNDHTIRSDMGTATAEVLSAGSLRSAVSFVTPDGVTHNPELGVLYPTDLTTGQRIAVEYARSDPDLVRVTGRDARIAIVPAGSVIVATWVIAGGLLLYLRSFSRAEPEPAPLA